MCDPASDHSVGRRLRAARIDAARARISSNRFSHAWWRRLASWMNGEYPIALIMIALNARHRRAQRADDVDEQHDAGLVGLVPRRVLAACRRRPGSCPPPSARSAVRRVMPTRSAGLGHLQPEVVPQHALVRAVVRRDALARRRGSRTSPSPCRGSLDRARVVSGQRAQFGVALEAVAVEEVRLPPVVVGELVLVGGDVLEVGQCSWSREHLVELGADRRPVAPRPARPTGSRLVEEVVVADERRLPEVAVDRPQEALAQSIGDVDRPLACRRATLQSPVATSTLYAS